MQPHHIRHLLSGTLVFFLGVAVNESMILYRRSLPKIVRWSKTETQTNFHLPRGLPPEDAALDMGVTEDGTIVWRIHPK